MEPSSSRVLGFTAGLCGLNSKQRYQIESVAWVLGQKHPSRADDVVQSMALRAWTNHLFARGTTTGELIAAGNRVAYERSS